MLDAAHGIREPEAAQHIGIEISQVYQTCSVSNVQDVKLFILGCKLSAMTYIKSL